jgi:hypothetical protein
MDFGLMNGFIGLSDTAHDYTSQFTITHIHVFNGHCLVVAANDGRSPFSGFLNYPQLQLPASYSNSS